MTNLATVTVTLIDSGIFVVWTLWKLAAPRRKDLLERKQLLEELMSVVAGMWIGVGGGRAGGWVGCAHKRWQYILFLRTNVRRTSNPANTLLPHGENHRGGGRVLGAAVPASLPGCQRGLHTGENRSPENHR